MRCRPQSRQKARHSKSLALKQAYGISALEEVREQDSAERAENEFPWDDVSENEDFGATQQLLSTPASEVARLERQQEALVRHSAASRIQAAARGKNSRRREWQLRQETAAATIQSAGRGWKARRHRDNLLLQRRRESAATTMQKLARGTNARSATRAKRFARRQAAIKIQGLQRARTARADFHRKRHAATSIQAAARARSGRHCASLRREEQKTRLLAQRRREVQELRGHFVRRVERMPRLDRGNAATRIQSLARGKAGRLASKIRQDELIAEKRSRMLAAREEQRNLREYYMARINRSEAETVAAQTLQAHIRSYNVRKTIRNRDASVLHADGSAMKVDEEEEGREGGRGGEGEEEEEEEEDKISDSTMQALILRMGVQIQGHGFAIVSVSEVQPSSASAKMFCFTMYSVPEAHIRSAMYNLPRHLAHANESTVCQHLRHVAESLTLVKGDNNSLAFSELPVPAHANRNHNGNSKTDKDSDHQWGESTGKKTDLGEHADVNHQSPHDTSPTEYVGQADLEMKCPLYSPTAR